MDANNLVNYCNKCGTILVEKADFCYYCGNKVDGSQIKTKSDVKSIEKPIGLIIFPILDLLIILKIPVLGIVGYFLMVISAQIEPSIGPFARADNTGLAAAMRGNTPVLPEYFELVYFGAILILIMIHIITAFCFITGKKMAWKIAFARLIIPMISLIILLSIVLFENIEPMLFLVVFITVPSLIVGVLIMIYFYLKSNDIKKYLGLV
jgi:hypothetical protein